MTEHQIIDMHFHVGVNGDIDERLGKLLDEYKQDTVFKFFLFFLRIKEKDVQDKILIQKTVETINTSSHINKVVCLALDHVYDENGNPEQSQSNMWVSNQFVLNLQSKNSKILFGASVHPYDENFQSRVTECIKKGAVFLKWLPSAQQIDLAHEKTLKALEFLAQAKNGKPLPLLLHVGPEYAIPSKNPKTTSYDFLSWSKSDAFWNQFRGKKKWYKPKLKKIHANLKTALDKGAVIIFAHCGLPYFSSFAFFEHSDFHVIKRYLNQYPASGINGGRCYADVSACATPFRKQYFKSLKKLPAESLLFGSDLPTPVFELSADAKEVKRDFKAILKGKFDRIIVPQDNLLDVNYRELSNVFKKGHSMFTNFNQFL